MNTPKNTVRTLIHERVEKARLGQNPTVICKMPAGWAVLSDNQVTEGYCLLLSDPVVGTLNDLPEETRLVFLRDMARLGDAVLKVTGAVRINYEILGNLDVALHAHVIPRYLTEPEELRRKPIWFYDFNAARSFNPQDDQELMEKIRQALQGCQEHE
jgi:diadenosine tetraphosphate (Ap4A) HIT family hydrolase